MYIFLDTVCTMCTWKDNTSVPWREPSVRSSERVNVWCVDGTE
jgi:hypothetical protein